MRDAASRATFVSPTEVRCLAPSRDSPELAYVSVSNDGSVWAPPLPLSYYVPPLLTRVLPPAADLHDDTTLALTATHTFERGANLLCAFREALPEDVEEAAEEEEEEDLAGRRRISARRRRNRERKPAGRRSTLLRASGIGPPAHRPCRHLHLRRRRVDLLGAWDVNDAV